MNRIYRATAVVLPALLGQGLIYLCIGGTLDPLTAIFGIAAIGCTALFVAAHARRRLEERLVWENKVAVLGGRVLSNGAR